MFFLLSGHRTGFQIWTGGSQPKIEENWHWFHEGGRAQFRWELRKNGKKADGFVLQGPLIRFENEFQ